MFFSTVDSIAVSLCGEKENPPYGRFQSTLVGTSHYVEENVGPRLLTPIILQLISLVIIVDYSQ